MGETIKLNHKIYENEILNIYKEIKDIIIARIDDFKRIWIQADNKELFTEMAFCLFTPQSSARQCWKAINILIEKNLLFEGTWEEVSSEINIVRFRNNKAKYLIEARKKFICDNNNIRDCLNKTINQYEKRNWLVKNVKGMGLKEASHFMRNIGIGDNLAILDRHILKNMKLLGLIDEVPKSISPQAYKEIENKLFIYSINIAIPIEHLDFVLWYKEAGEVFK